jgi:nucleoside triphosphate diphosphatase
MFLGRRVTSVELKALWAAIKAEEKSSNKVTRAGTGHADDERGGVLSGIPAARPGLTRAVKLQAKASTAGFDWNDARLMLEKIREETGEIDATLDAGDQAALNEEIGDLLFAVANLARHLNTDPEAAIRRANAKFERRFCFIEEQRARANRPAPLRWRSWKVMAKQRES